ncbi:MAG: hypothetical protein AAFY98_12565 [Verrucomicrobiota bacterium]
MIEEIIFLEEQEYLFQGSVKVSEEEPEFSVFYEIRSQDRPQLQLEIRLKATNPLGIDDIIIGTATMYGLCIAGTLTRRTAAEAINCYRESKRENPDRDLLGHATAAGKCLAGKGDTMKDAAVGALVDCLRLPRDDGADS